MAWGQSSYPPRAQQQQQAPTYAPAPPPAPSASGAATSPHAEQQQHYPPVSPASGEWSAGGPTGSAYASAPSSAPHHAHPVGASPPPGYHPQGSPQPQQPPEGGATPGHLQVEIPGLAPQPWVRDLWSWLATNTVGVARVDLLRPTLPSPDQYYRGNLLFASYKQRASSTLVGAATTGGWQPFRGRPRPTPPPPPYYQPPPQQGPYRGAAPGYPPAGPAPQRAAAGGARARQAAAVVEQQQQVYGAYPYPPPEVQQEVVVASERPTPARGARVKITRSFMFWRDERREGRPMMDFGGGINIDMDRGRVEPVLRLKLGQVLSIRAFPTPCLKLSSMVPLGRTGMGLKVHFDVPLDSLHRFYQPPARLMLRLDPLPGSGVRLTPTGVELDQTSMRFGQSITMRASAGINFPRTLPIDPENDDLGLKVHRLSLKALW